MIRWAGRLDGVDNATGRGRVGRAAQHQFGRLSWLRRKAGQHTGQAAFLSNKMIKEPEPMRECPRYAACSVNHCPLDPEQDRHESHPDDKERKCPMEKGVRHRIGFKYHHLLPLDGLTPAEVAGARSWAKLPAAQQWERREAARERMTKLRDRRNPRL